MSLLLLIALGLLLALFLMGRNASQTATQQAERDASERGQQGSQQSQKSPRQSARESANKARLGIANAKINGQITDQEEKKLNDMSPEKVVAWLEGRMSGKSAQQPKQQATPTPLQTLPPSRSSIPPSAAASRGSFWNTRARSGSH